ncbi:unnamed protein product [Caenorhabditis auriculariae]|uniref:Uncharacterized protein n=1 Tax=Caenorhabditis auriculariae TaxID=2777116 RepID=A0A8S1GS77_9PELO|nr:unnamed protein product [Caenorhabditis auriculariae]
MTYKACGGSFRSDDVAEKSWKRPLGSALSNRQTLSSSHAVVGSSFALYGAESLGESFLSSFFCPTSSLVSVLASLFLRLYRTSEATLFTASGPTNASSIFFF